MNLTAIDWAIVVGYFALSTVIGFIFTKRGGESLEEYFLSGRQVPWWLAGAAMVATTFAADTPLVVTGLVATKGVAGNWLWWNMVMSGMLTVFFFARLWRRARVMTDVEFAEIRYSGKPAAFLRGFRALYLGIAVNLIIMGWVTRAMIKILTISLGISPYLAVGICFVITVAYAVAAGLWAVLWTDLIQFVIKMSAVIVLAIYAVNKVGGMDSLIAGVSKHFGSETAALSVLPVRATPNGLEAYAWMPLLALAVFLSMQWWAAYYPGAEPGGGGYVAQRMFSAKDEKNSLGATLWFNIAHYALRPWPWVVTGLVALVVYSPHGGLHPSADFAANPEQGYVMVLRDYLPPALRGLMVAAFLAAFMSTIGTQLNWGSSYLVNDLYKRFFVRDATEKHYVLISKIFTVVLVLGSGYTATKLASINQGWQLVLNIGFGTGAVYILRWYWSRINAWSEIVAMAVAALMTIGLSRVSFTGNDSLVYAKTALITGLVTTIAWVIATFVTRPESDETLIGFYKRVHPTVYGWKRIAEMVPEMPQVRDMAGNAFNWLMGVILVYGCLFGIGKIVFGQWGWGVFMLALSAVAGYLIFWDLSRRGWSTYSGKSLPVGASPVAEGD